MARVYADSVTTKFQNILGGGGGGGAHATTITTNAITTCTIIIMIGMVHSTDLGN